MNLRNNHGGVAILLAAAAVFGVSGAQAGPISGQLTSDNGFFAYISTDDNTLGTLVASGTDWRTVYSFNSNLLTEGVTNYLHIEAVNTEGPGGLIGQFSLVGSNFVFANGTQLLLTGSSSGLRGGYNDSNSLLTAQSWVKPTAGVVDLGANGVAPWGAVSGINSNAHWIWPSDSQSYASGSTCGACTVDFSATITVSPEPGTYAMLGGALAILGSIRRRRAVR